MKIRHYVRFVLFVLLAVIFFWIGGSLLWMPLAAAAIYFFIKDVFPRAVVNQVKSAEKSTLIENSDVDDGILGSYLVDSTKVHGLFLTLGTCRMFVDIKQDQFEEDRDKRALLLFREKSTLESSLARFLERNPSFASRRITYIGLHASGLSQGEVFWAPSGYTLIKGLEFLDPDVS